MSPKSELRAAAGCSSSPPLDALVILGCRVLPGGRAGRALERRVHYAAELFRAGVARRVVMSGGRRWHGVAEAEAMLTLWVELALPRSVVLLERRSLTTRGNAHCSAELLRAEGMTRVAVVTCDYHLPRAQRHFAAEGLLVRGYGVSVKRRRTYRVWLWTRELGAHILERLALRRAHWMDAAEHGGEAKPLSSP